MKRWASSGLLGAALAVHGSTSAEPGTVTDVLALSDNDVQPIFRQ
jgi:hypothetical protein